MMDVEGDVEASAPGTYTVGDQNTEVPTDS
jgi:hypothetical protein